MSLENTPKQSNKGSSRRVTKRSHSSTSKKDISYPKFSPAWVAVNSKGAPGYNLELIERIRIGVNKKDWKQLIVKIGATEKEFEHVLPTSISSMQKKSIYDSETSERIYELARLYSLGHEVFDTKEDFKNWLMTPSKALGGKIPFELLDSSLGFKIVEDEIIRIQYNVYS